MTRKPRSIALALCCALALPASAVWDASGHSVGTQSVEASPHSSERHPTARSSGPFGKFIPSFVVKYGTPSDHLRSAQETANFDLLITSGAHHQVWGEQGLNSWRTLRGYNPDIVIALYHSGPGTYNVAPWGDLGEGWDWMTANHGDAAAADRWTAQGVNYGTYLQNDTWTNLRMMFLGSAGWQQYWIDTFYDDRWGGGRGEDHTAADAVFSDNTIYEVIRPNRWHREGDPSLIDHPQAYYDGAYLHEAWRRDTNAFLARAVPQLAAKPEQIKLILNFARLESNPEYWSELESQPAPPFAAMQEAGFIKRWGAFTFNYHQWVEKIANMKDRVIPVIVANHGESADLGAAQGLARMDLVGTDGATGWDALWFAISSFLIALDAERGNGYLGFTVWDYLEYYWFDEFDPRYLHLGAALGGHYVSGGVYFREYEDGWVVANPPYGATITGIPVPSGQARVIDHGSLKTPDAVPLVSTFDLGSARGIVLLKPGAQIGNQDNLPPPIPTISGWGVCVMGLVILVSGTLVCRRRRLPPRTAAVS